MVDGIAVFVATTDQPARVLRLIEAPHQRQSTACLNLRTVKAQFSDAYHDFVSRECGVIAAFTDRDQYRLDLSADIGSGESWQLGVFAAHVLARDGLLTAGEPATPVDPAGAAGVLWASGEVDANRKVHPVTDIARKLNVSAALFRAASDAGLATLLVLPEGNRTTELESMLTDLAATHPGLEWRFVAGAEPVTAQWRPDTSAATTSPQTARTPAPLQPVPRRRRWPLLVATVTVVAAAAVAVATLAPWRPAFLRAVLPASAAPLAETPASQRSTGEPQAASEPVAATPTAVEPAAAAAEPTAEPAAEAPEPNAAEPQASGGGSTGSTPAAAVDPTDAELALRGDFNAELASGNTCFGATQPAMLTARPLRWDRAEDVPIGRRLCRLTFRFTNEGGQTYRVRFHSVEGLLANASVAAGASESVTIPGYGNEEIVTLDITVLDTDDRTWKTTLRFLLGDP